MGLLDGILGGQVDIANMASQIGIDPAMAEKAVAALGQAHQEPGDTASLAAQKTGLGLGTIQQVIAAIGGEGSLAQFAGEIASNPQIMGLLDRDGDGDLSDELTGLASAFFGKK